MKKSLSILCYGIFIVSGVFYSCKNNEYDDWHRQDKKNVSSESPEAVTQIPQEVLASLTQSYRSTSEHPTRSSQEESKAEALEKVTTDLFTLVSGLYDRSKGEFVSFVLFDDKTKENVGVENVEIVRPQYLSDEEKVFIQGLNEMYQFNPSISESELFVKSVRKISLKARLKISCGKRSIVVNEPTGFVSARRFVEEAIGFIKDCLDKGGCITICRVSGTIH